jgi:phosphate transport system permease protein
LTFIAFLPPSPVHTDPPFFTFDWVWSPFSVLPIQMFNWVSRPEQEFLQNAAAAGIVLIIITLSMNAVAILIRYRVRKRIKW